MPAPVRWVVVAAAILAGLWLAGQLADVILLVLVALLFTTALLPVVQWLEDHRLPHTWAVSLCFAALLGLVVAAVAYLIPLALQQGRQLATSTQEAAARLDWAREHWQAWHLQYPSLLPSFSQMVAWGRRQGGQVLQATVGWTGALATRSAEGLATLVLTFFFLKDGRCLLAQVAGLFPLRVRREAPPVLSRVADRVGAWVRGQLLLMLAVGTLTLVGMWLIGMPYAFTVAVIAGLLEAVPYVGPILSAGVAMLVAVTVSWHMVLWTLVVFVVVQQLENHLLQPVIVGRSVGLHPAWVILAVLTGGELLGLIGMLLAVPAAAVLKILIGELYRRQRPAAPDRREAA